MKRINLQIQGLVQGVGFRPFIYALALKYSLNGFISNTTNGVHVQIQGKEKNLQAFMDELNNLPPLARIDKLDFAYMDLKNDKSFVIKKSENKNGKTSAILPDMAICEDCLNELNDETNKRYNYPFINCTNCGPRYSIIKDIPYDRPFTSMAKFTMCDECQKEYENPQDRRYHAQPISCPNCGPTLTLYKKNSTCKANEAIKEASRLIKKGKIIAIKGVGGFHLVCDASNDESIKRLRIFKSRPHKPFAIMCQNQKQASLHVKINKNEKQALNSIEKPIVLLSKKQNSTLSKLIAPHTQKLGIFLPNTPLHVILFNHISNPIIATSANIKSEPIITKKEDLDEKFGNLLGGILDFNRDILHPCDDSLVQMIGNEKLYLRVSRGIAPLTLPFESKVKKNILALGAEEKNAIAFYMNNKIILSPYLGGMDNIKTYELFEKTISSWKRFYDIEFDEIIHDNHQNYQSTKYAISQNKKTLHVNHHHAHILATLVDRKIPLNTKVLGVAWDGTGYGDDKTIWGGEFLVCEGRAYKRVAYFKPFKLLGGQKSIKNINRIAYSMLLDLNINLDEFKPLSFLAQIHQKNINSPLCSSVGRLFDAVCYLATGLKEVSYDGESGLMLEGLYDKTITSSYTLHVENGVIDYSQMLLEILKDKKNPKKIASKFLNSLANIIITISNTYNFPIILSGGVFQNKTLLQILKTKNKPIHFPQTLTPNDGSICIGQIAYGLSQNLQ